MTKPSNNGAERNGTHPPGADSPVGGPSSVERFAALFNGYSKAYGLFEMGKMIEGEKVAGKAKTVTGQVTLAEYRAHLDGLGSGLGIIMLRDDDTVVFGAIDYDNRDMDHGKAAAAIEKFGLPLVLCRSKSGGGHFYCFTSEPVPATLMRTRLGEWCALLGMAAKTEQFPKQSGRHSDTDVGSWINLPYYDAAHTVRYALGAEGAALTLEQFLDLAERRRQSLAQLRVSAAAAQQTEDALFHEGPPCLQVIASAGGFAEGERNLGMAAAIVYLKKRFPDSWKAKVDEYNAKMAALPSTEIQHIVQTHARKDYSYQCSQPPINARCQRSACTRRMYGVGQTYAEEGSHTIDALIRYDSVTGDDPMWGMEIAGKRVLVSNKQFYSRDTFNQACMAQANVVPVHMPPARWLRTLNKLISKAEIVPMPGDAGPTGQLWEWIVQFCSQQANALVKEEVWMGKPYREEGQIYFRSQDLFKYLRDRRVNFESEQKVWHLLRERGGETKFWHIGGRGVNVWVLPAPSPAPQRLPVGLPESGTEDF